MSLENRTIQDILSESGDVSPEDIERINAYATENGINFTKAAQTSGIITDQRVIVKALAHSLELQYVPIRELEIDVEAAHLMTGEQVRHYGVIPIQNSAGFITFAVPIKFATNLTIKDDLKRITGARGIEFMVAAKQDIDQTIEEVFRVDRQLEEISKKVEEDKDAENASLASSTTVPDEITEESMVSKFVNLVLSQAVQDKASDIHFDPQEREMLVRYRIDGILYPQTRAPQSSIRPNYP